MKLKRLILIFLGLILIVIIDTIPPAIAESPEDIVLGDEYCILNDGQYAYYKVSNLSNTPGVIIIHWKYQTFENEIPIQVLLFEEEDYSDWKIHDEKHYEEELDTRSNGTGSYNTERSGIWYLVFLNENDKGISTKLKTEIIYENGTIDLNGNWAVQTSRISLVPSTPNIYGYDTDNNEITLHWSYSTINGTYFNGRYSIFKDNGSEDFIFIGSSSSNSFTDFDVINGQSYYYKVYAYPYGIGSSSRTSNIQRTIPENKFERNATIFGFLIGILSICTFIDRYYIRITNKYSKNRQLKFAVNEFRSLKPDENFQKALWKLKSLDKELLYRKYKILLVNEKNKIILIDNENILKFNLEGKLIES